MCSYCLTMKKIIQEIKNLKSQQLHIFSRCTWIVPACSKGLRSSSTCPSHLIMKSSSWLCSTKFVTNHVVAVCEAEIAPQTAVTSGRSNSCRSCRQSQLLLSYFPLYSCKLWKPVFPKLLKYQYFNENLLWNRDIWFWRNRPPHHNLQYLVLCLCEYELSGLELRLLFGCPISDSRFGVLQKPKLAGIREQTLDLGYNSGLFFTEFIFTQGVFT